MKNIQLNWLHVLSCLSSSGMSFHIFTPQTHTLCSLTFTEIVAFISEFFIYFPCITALSTSVAARSRGEGKGGGGESSAASDASPEGTPQEEYTFFSHARNLHEKEKSV